MATITVIGTGLIGSSMGMALRKQGHFVIGCDKSEKHLEVAKQRNAIDATIQYPDPRCFGAGQSINQSISQSSVVILATPVDQILEIINQVLDNLPCYAVVIDTGSTKMAICQKIRNHPRRNAFVAAHPMAGVEKSGPEHATPSLFLNRTVAICEAELSSDHALRCADEIFNLLGLRKINLTPSEHDNHSALVSHLPQLMAFAFTGMNEFQLSQYSHWPALAASGFDSITRLANGLSSTWIPIFSQNKEAVSTLARSMAKLLENFVEAIDSDDSDRVNQIIEQSNGIRNIFLKSKELQEIEVRIPK